VQKLRFILSELHPIMGKGTALTEYEKGQIEALFGEGKSVSYISLKIDRSRAVISSYLKQGANYGTAPRSGRLCTIYPMKSKAIIKDRKKIITANQIKAQLGIGSSKDTILRVIYDLKRLKLKRKPVLSDLHKAKRIDFAKRYMDLGEKWKYVIWSDEKKFNLDGPDGYDYYWHSLGEDAPVLSRRAMGGGRVMIWACFDFFGASEIILIEGSIDSGKYQSVLASHLLPGTILIQFSSKTSQATRIRVYKRLAALFS